MIIPTASQQAVSEVLQVPGSTVPRQAASGQAGQTKQLERGVTLFVRTGEAIRHVLSQGHSSKGQASSESKELHDVGVGGGCNEKEL